MDSAARQTEKKLKEVEKTLEKLYKDSQADITKAWKEYMAAQNAYVKDLQEAYQNAKLYGTAKEAREIGKELGVAKAERTLQNQYYKDMVKETTKKLAEVNQTALAYVNNQMTWVYTTNFNQAAKDAEKVGFNFHLVDEGTVKRRVLDGDITSPFMTQGKHLNIPKDMRWNTKQLNSSVLQGIVNGESMQKIADRILPIVNNNTSAAIRNARTMVTGAQNEGRQDSYEYMQDNGVLLNKVWMATHDERTRTSHAELDGEEVGINDPFSNGLMYPGDPNGDPEEVYNCRCTMVTHVVGFEKADGRIEYVDIPGYEPEYEFTQLEDKTPAGNSFAESLIEKEYSPNISEYRSVEDYWKAKAEWQGEKTKYVDDMFEYGSFTTETAWAGNRNEKIPTLEGTIADLNDKYPAKSSGKFEYGTPVEHLTVCEYSRAWEFLPDGKSDRRLTSDAAAQVFFVTENDKTSAVIAFNRSTLTETLEGTIQTRQKAIDSGDILSSIGFSPEATAIHEWGHVMSNHLNNAMIYQDETVVEYWNWYKSLSKDEIRKGISDYATANRGEFEAECFAELQMPNPRPIAVKFKEYLDEVIKKGY